MTHAPHRLFAERQWPSVGFFLVLLLLIPAVTMLFVPRSVFWGFIAGIGAYVLFAALFLLGSRSIEVVGDKLVTGRASIPVAQLGEMTVLDKHELSITIGRHNDARAFLVINGWIHTAVKITVTDPEDPTPYWVVTTRKPEALVAAIQEAQRAPQTAS